MDTLFGEENFTQSALQLRNTHKDTTQFIDFMNNSLYDSDDDDDNESLQLEPPIFQRGVNIRFDRELPNPADTGIDYPTLINEYIKDAKKDIDERVSAGLHSTYPRAPKGPGHPLREPSTFWTTSSPSRHAIFSPTWDNREYQECLALIDNPEKLDLLLGTSAYVQRFIHYLRNHHDEISLSLVQDLDRKFAQQNSPLGWHNCDGSLHLDWIYILDQHKELIRFAPPTVRDAFWGHKKKYPEGQPCHDIPSVRNDGDDKENGDPEAPDDPRPKRPRQPSQAYSSDDASVLCDNNQDLRDSAGQSKRRMEYGTRHLRTVPKASACITPRRGARSLTLKDMLSEEADEITNRDLSAYYTTSNSQEEDDSNFEPEIELNANGKRQNGATFKNPNKAQTTSNAPSQPKTRGGNKHMHNKWPQCRIDMFKSANRGKPLPAAAQGGKVHPIDSFCTPEIVDIRFIGQHAITAVELATFFPKHTAWRSIMHRFVRNGWESGSITKFVMYSRGIQNPDAMTASALSHAKAKALEWATEKGMPTGIMTDFTAGNIVPDRDTRGINKDLIDYRIADLAQGVKVMPSGEDRQLLTAAVELAIQTKSDVLLSQFPQYVTQNWNELHKAPGIIPLNQMDGNVDEDGLTRVWGEVTTWARKVGYKRR
jgi:hypothetical protein